jgi:hypothetical protein
MGAQGAAVYRHVRGDLLGAGNEIGGTSVIDAVQRQAAWALHAVLMVSKLFCGGVRTLENYLGVLHRLQ